MAIVVGPPPNTDGPRLWKWLHLLWQRTVAATSFTVATLPDRTITQALVITSNKSLIVQGPLTVQAVITIQSGGRLTVL